MDSAYIAIVRLAHMITPPFHSIELAHPCSYVLFQQYTLGETKLPTQELELKSAGAGDVFAGFYSIKQV